jgi:hypothetical protein
MSQEENNAVVERKPTNIQMGSHGGLQPTDLEGLWRLSLIMSKSGFMPKGLTTTEAVFVAVQMGLEVGLSPMQAVQNIAVINGRPTIWGDAQLALIQGSGQLEIFKEYFEGEWGKSNFKAVCQVRRRGFDVVTSEFSMEDARVAGLLSKEGPWKTYPKRMLQMRARGFALRDTFADVLKGIKSTEEALDTPSYDLDMGITQEGKYEVLPEQDVDAQTSPDENPSGNLPKRSRRNKFTGLDKERFPGGKIETCGVKPEQLVELRKLASAFPENASHIKRYMSVNVGYAELSYLREDEALELTEHLRPLPVDEPPKEDFFDPPESAFQKPVVVDPLPEMPDAQPAKEEERVLCPIENETRIKSFCMEQCRIRKGDNFCIALGEKPPKSGFMGGAA